MVGHMQQQDRVVREHRVQVIPRQLPPVGQVRDVIPVADDPVAGPDLELRHMCLESGENVGNRGDRTRRGALHIDPFDHLWRVHEMAMRVDEGRQQGRAFQVDDLGGVRRQCPDACLVAQCQDATAPHGHGLNLRKGFVERQDRATEINPLRGCPCLREGHPGRPKSGCRKENSRTCSSLQNLTAIQITSRPVQCHSLLSLCCHITKAAVQCRLRMVKLDHGQRPMSLDINPARSHGLFPAFCQRTSCGFRHDHERS